MHQQHGKARRPPSQGFKLRLTPRAIGRALAATPQQCSPEPDAMRVIRLRTPALLRRLAK